jgi:HPt (histidine-containing phosphotransfer) domain-containing protein
MPMVTQLAHLDACSDIFEQRASTPAKPAPVDHAHLRRYTMGDLQLEREVLVLFAGELPRTVAELRSARSERDWKIAAHTLKGSARAVGAWDVADSAVTAEQNSAAIVDSGLRYQTLAVVEAAVGELIAYIEGLPRPS